jgi:hypothetical protein
MRDAVGALRIDCREGALAVTACVGVAAVEHLADEMLSLLLHEAETAVRVAKREGPGRVVCSWQH